MEIIARGDLCRNQGQPFALKSTAEMLILWLVSTLLYVILSQLGPYETRSFPLRFFPFPLRKSPSSPPAQYHRHLH